MTEDEAFLLWCPDVKIAIGNDIHASFPGTTIFNSPGSATNMPATSFDSQVKIYANRTESHCTKDKNNLPDPEKAYNCIGSRCMAWRWDKPVGTDWHGYCGRYGTPRPGPNDVSTP